MWVDGETIVVLLRCFTSCCYWAHEIAWPNQNSVFQKCELVVCQYARLGLWNDNCGTRTKLRWWVRVHKAWQYAKQIEKVFSLTCYKTLMTDWLLYNIANQLFWKHIVPTQCSFSHHIKWEPEKLCSYTYSISVTGVNPIYNTEVFYLLDAIAERLLPAGSILMTCITCITITQLKNSNSVTCIYKEVVLPREEKYNYRRSCSST